MRICNGGSPQRRIAAWLKDLRGDRARAKITSRLDRIAFGLMGDVKVFDGLTELRIDYGPGYRIYAAQRGRALIILLCAGDKDSQRRDIVRAKKMLSELE